ncbi:hypothetical protein BVY04_00950 [bacterium M21]|nr:hypothetical protein BVY04_00950 [bacterium M21]
MYGVSNSDYCEDAKYDAKIYVEDAIRYGAEGAIPNATVYYSCVGFRCRLGETDYIRNNGQKVSETTLLDAKLPECYNGAIVVESKDHVFEPVFVTSSDIEGSIIIQGKPKIELPLNLEIKEFNADIVTEKDFDYDKYTSVITVLNNDNQQFTYSVYIPNKTAENRLVIKIPLNSSDDNNLTIDVRLLDVENNVSVGGYYYEGILDGSEVAHATTMTLPVLTMSAPPTNEETMVKLYSEIIFGKSALFEPELS